MLATDVPGNKCLLIKIRFLHHPTPMRCPRCSSLDTKFDYFNNRSLAQPRHHCRTCKRQWTVGGKLRNIPIGGSSRSISKQAKASSSRSGSWGAHSSQATSKMEEEHLQNAQILSQTEATAPQDFDEDITQPTTNLPEVSELPCPKSKVINQHVAYGSESSTDGGNMRIVEEWNIQEISSQQVLPELIPIHNSPYQPHDQANTVPPRDFYNNSLIDPGQHENSLPQEIPNDFNFSTSDHSLQNNFIGNSTNQEEDSFFVSIDESINNPDDDTSSVNIDEWLNLSDHSTP